MPIAIVAAMPEEIDALKAFMPSPRKVVRAGREFLHGDLFGQEAVIVFSRWGKVASASTATELILAFRVSAIVLVGIAGSISDLNIGDVVVASDCVQHDLDSRPFFPVTEIPLLGVSSLMTDMKLRRELMQACTEAGAECRHWLNPELRAAAGISHPRIVEGRMATGDQVISTRAQREEILQRAPGTLSVDMESAAVAQVAFEHQVPFACVRVISDGADEVIAKSVGPFLGGLAAAYCIAIVRAWLTARYTK